MLVYPVDYGLLSVKNRLVMFVGEKKLHVVKKSYVFDVVIIVKTSNLETKRKT